MIAIVDIRRRSAQSSPASCQGNDLSDGVGSSHLLVPTTRSLPSLRRKRPASPRKLASLLSALKLPIGFIVVGAFLALNSLSVFVYFVPQPNNNDAAHPTMDKKLHHERPSTLRRDMSLGGVVGMEYLPQRPRMLGYYYQAVDSESFLGSERLDATTFRLRLTRRFTALTANAAYNEGNIDADSFMEGQARPERSSDNNSSGRVERFEHGDCVAQYQWQKQSFPTCNHLMEQDLTHLEINANGTMEVKIMAHGYWRDVWSIRSSNYLDGNPEQTVLKTMRYQHEFNFRNYDRHRRDAVAMEQLTSSQWIMNIYGFCGNSGIFEFADGGDLNDSIFAEEDSEDWSSSERLVVAYQVAAGIAAVHNHHKEGVAAMAHTDITTLQFVYVSSAGIYKLNDFNRCRFIRWNKKTNQACTFLVGNNPGVFRAPEEFSYKEESEKVDIYSMGNVFYSILTGEWPFEDVESKEARDLVKRGHRPPISPEILNSTDPFQQTLLNVTRACWLQDPKERASARRIQNYIEKRLVKFGVTQAPG